MFIGKGLKICALEGMSTYMTVRSYEVKCIAFLNDYYLLKNLADKDLGSIWWESICLQLMILT